MIRRLASDSCGMTLIELLIVLAVIGLTASIAGVYISSGKYTSANHTQEPPFRP